MYQVMIVEDDPMVASINKQYVEMNSAFHVVQVCRDGREGLEYLSQQTVDLIILDYYTPAMTCTEFMGRLHSMEQVPAVIMVTSNNDTQTVQGLLSRGVLDYLVKPFQYTRFHQALSRFLTSRQLLETEKENVDQRTIDQLIHSRELTPAAAPLPKGLNLSTMDHIRQFFASHPEEHFTSEQVAERLGLSRITIRRYVSYMAEAGEISSSIDYQTGGRPAIRYFHP